ncbi:MAG: helix-turn-helix domain-containing protein [bacterium]
MTTRPPGSVLTDLYQLIEGDPEAERLLREARIAARVAQQIYDARTAAGLTQAQLAELVGTRQSVIARLEDADYTSHSLRMLRRIASALGMHVEVALVPDAPVAQPQAPKRKGRAAA